MKLAPTELTSALTLPQYPRSATYDPTWVMDNLMGPNVLWLTEALTQVMDLQPGMRVLDLGCGRAVSSIFLAKEFDLQVWATDLWIKPTPNWERIQAAKQEHRIFPIYAEAHALPYADAFFDAIVSLDAYHYFGTDDLYLSYISRFLKPGGQIGIVCPGLLHEFESGVPEHLVPFWDPSLWSFHSPDWWRTHWLKSTLVDVTHADMIPDGWKLWLNWLQISTQQGYPDSPEETEMVRVDAGRNLGFTRIVARKK